MCLHIFPQKTQQGFITESHVVVRIEHIRIQRARAIGVGGVRQGRETTIEKIVEILRFSSFSGEFIDTLHTVLHIKCDIIQK